MNNTKSISEILKEAGLMNNEKTYLEVSIKDDVITPEILKKIHDGVLEDKGEGDAKAVREMIIDLPTLKPAIVIRFMNRFHIFMHDDGWWWDKKKVFDHFSGMDKTDWLNMPVCVTTEKIKADFVKLF